MASSSCGIIYGFTELYGAESVTQVARLILDLKDNFKGNQLSM